MKTTSQRGVNLIKKWEGCKLDAYLCPAGVPTIGYGHTKDVYIWLEVTQDKAEELLRADLSDFEHWVSRLVAVELKQCQFDALVSFTYNLGQGNLRSSTLLKKLNEGNYMGAANEFPRWNKAGGKVLKGLVDRRKDEQDRFLDK